MKSVDLFSGIGGITHALRGISRPVIYCDIDTTCQKILKHNMKKGRLPPAPVHEDVRTLKRSIIPDKIDLITAGFPCTGFSNIGLRDGFENEQSSLFSEVLRLIDELTPLYVFLENVPPIIKKGMPTILRELRKRSYSLRWCVLGGTMLGAQHERKRWFCLAVQNGAPQNRITINRKYSSYCWAREIVPRMKLKLEKYDHKRCAALGNAVIPDVVRAAFLFLAKGLSCTAPIDLSTNQVTLWEPIEQGVLMISEKAKAFGASAASNDDDDDNRYMILSAVNIPDLKKCFINSHGITQPLRFNPLLYSPSPGTKPSPRRSLPSMRNVHTQRLWSTPRHSCVTTSHVMTSRNIRDLPTQLRFEEGTPDELRKGWVNPQFVEWLMGYPIDWTKLDQT